MTGADLCRRAADLIRAGGLCKGHYAKGASHCAIGALVRAAGYDPLDENAWMHSKATAMDAVEESVSRMAKMLSRLNPASWNDEPERTAEDVADLLQRTALTFEDSANG